MKSILQDYEEEFYCYNCGSHSFLQSHHCIGGRGRRVKSEKYGLKVLFCNQCHDAAHNGNNELLRALQLVAQSKFEETHSREEFIQEFGISFL